MRHQAQWLDGIDLDDESSLNHLAHVAANILMLLEYQLSQTGNDDRYKYDNNKE